MVIFVRSVVVIVVGSAVLVTLKASDHGVVHIYSTVVRS